MFNRLKITVKLPLAMVVICAVAVLLSELTASQRAVSALIDAGDMRLRAVADSRAAEVKERLSTIRRSLFVERHTPLMLEAAQAFAEAFNEEGKEGIARLRRLYLDENPNTVNRREYHVDAGDGSAFSRAHALYHPIFARNMRNGKFADILIVTAEGQVVYSASKSDMFGRSFSDFAFGMSSFAAAVRRAMRAEEPFADVTSDFTDVRTDRGYAVATMAGPIRDAEGRTVAVLAYRVSTRALQDILDRPAGLGETGVTYLVDETGKRLSRSGTRGMGLIPDIPERVRVAETGAGARDVLRLTRSDGEEILRAVQPFPFMTNSFSVIAEQSADEVATAARAVRQEIMRDSLWVLVLISTLGFLVARATSVPLGRLRESIDKVALKDFSYRIPDRARSDEIGDIAKQLESFRARLLEAEGVGRENRMKGAAFSAASAPLMVTDRDMTVIYVNDSLVSLMRRNRVALDRLIANFRPDQLTGRSLVEFFPGAGRAQTVLQSESVFSEPFRAGQSWLRLTIVPVRDESEDVLGYAVEWSDESHAKKNRLVLDTLDEHLPLAGFSRDGRLIWANAAFAQWHGSLAGEMAGLSWDRIVQARDPGVSGVRKWEDLVRKEPVDLVVSPGRIDLRSDSKGESRPALLARTGHAGDDVGEALLLIVQAPATASKLADETQVRTGPPREIRAI